MSERRHRIHRGARGEEAIVRPLHPQKQDKRKRFVIIHRKNSNHKIESHKNHNYYLLVKVTCTIIQKCFILIIETIISIITHKI